MIGREFGRYRVVAPLGQGGMASVWRAQDTLLDRTVALKVLSTELAASPDARRRFERESEVAQLLDHPVITQVYDFGETDGRPWLVMACVEGETWTERLARGLPPLTEAQSAAAIVASALGYAHTRGVLHRDISARNIMLARDGRVLLLDFGMASVEGASRLTRSGTVAGTLLYLAPEVLAGGRPDPCSDLYSLAAVFYETVTGTPPHRGDSLERLLYAKTQTSPRAASDLRAGVPEALDAFFVRALARAPEARFVDAEEFLRALRAVDLARVDTSAAAHAHDADPSATTEEIPRVPPGAGPAVPAPSALPSPVRAPGEVLARGEAVAYLGVPAFACAAEDVAELGALADALAKALRHRLGRPGHVHVIQSGKPLTVAGPRAWAREQGANLLLVCGIRRSGERVSVEFSLLDPHADATLTGDTVAGSRFDAIDLEHRLVESVRTHWPEVLESSDPEHESEEVASDATDRLLQALRYLQRHDHEPSVDAAVGLLERVVAHHAEAPALAALTRAYLAKYALTHQHIWHDRAAATLQRAVESSPDQPDVQLAHADLCASAGLGDEARRLYGRALESNPENFEGWVGLARFEASSGQFEAAERACRRAIALRSRDWRGYSILGNIYYRQGLYQLSLAPWRRALRLSPEHSRMASNLAVILYHLDRFEESEAAFRRALSLEPTAATWSNLGTVLYAQHRFKEAMGAYGHACELRHADPRYWGHLGNAARLVPGEEQRAEQAFQRAVGLMRESLARNPQDAENWAILAGWLADRGEEATARDAISRALSLAPGDMRCLTEAIHTHTLLGELDRAMEFLDRAVRSGHGVRELERSIELAPLREHPAYARTVSEALEARRLAGGAKARRT